MLCALAGQISSGIFRCDVLREGAKNLEFYSICSSCTLECLCGMLTKMLYVWESCSELVQCLRLCVLLDQICHLLSASHASDE